jgi:predicted nucleotidyltransferase
LQSGCAGVIIVLERGCGNVTIEEIKRKTAPILERHGVAYAAVFGSVARGEDRPWSDVDILVRLGRPMGMVGYMRLIQNLEEILQRKVDVVTERSLNEHVRPYVLPDLKTIYEK